jgi:phage tail protein X
MEYVPYYTKDGDTWTGIGYKATGSINRAREIIEANPGVPITDVLPGGIRLQVPLFEEVELDVVNLPPWKR